MIPNNFAKEIPRALQIEEDSAGRALCAKMDSILAEWRSSACGIGHLLSPDHCPSELLNELAYYVGYDPLVSTVLSTFLVDDSGDFFVDESGNHLMDVQVFFSDTQENPAKRRGIFQACRSYKNWDLFEGHIKPMLDGITSFSSSITKGNLLVDEAGEYLVDTVGARLSDLPMDESYIFIDLGGEGMIVAYVLALVLYRMRKYCNLAYIEINIGDVIDGAFVSYAII